MNKLIVFMLLATLTVTAEASERPSHYLSITRESFCTEFSPAYASYTIADKALALRVYKRIYPEYLRAEKGESKQRMEFVLHLTQHAVQHNTPGFDLSTLSKSIQDRFNKGIAVQCFNFLGEIV